MDASDNRGLFGVGGLAGIDGGWLRGGAAFWTPGRCGSTARPGFPASCGQTPPVEPAPSPHVVGHVGERHCRGGARHADGADHKAHRPLLVREGMLDMGAHGGLLGVAACGAPGNRLALRLAPVDAADLADPREEALVLRRAVGAVGPDVGGGVCSGRSAPRAAAPRHAPRRR
jgi:hypothetical protein